MFLAEDLTRAEPERESTEADMVHAWVAEHELRAMIRCGELADGHSVAALALYDNRGGDDSTG